MCRLRTNFARLGDPLLCLHKGKQANLATLVEIHLYPRLRRRPPEGEILAAIYNEQLKLALREADRKPPPPGEVP